MSFGRSDAVRSCNRMPRTDGPAPGDYEVTMTSKGRLNTTLHAKHSHNKSGGGSMGYSTSERTVNLMPRNDNPGPGDYEVTMTSKGRLNSSLHAKHSHNKSGGGSMGYSTSERTVNLMPKCESPGPGDYEVSQTSKGRLNTTLHACHSHNKSGGGSMGYSTSERTVNLMPKNDNPGPGDYEVKMTSKGRLNTTLHACHSHNKSGGGSMGYSTSERTVNLMPKGDNPGPGDYEVTRTSKGRLNTTLHACHSHNKSGGGSMGLSTSERTVNLMPKNDNPGPGDYEANMTSKGRLNTTLHACHSHNKSGGGSMGLSTSERTVNLMPKGDGPGPGDYEATMTSKGRLNTALHATHSHNKSGGGSMGWSSSERTVNLLPVAWGPAPGDYEVRVTNKGRLDTALHVK